MAIRRDPVPRQKDRQTQALVEAHFSAVEQDRQRHDASRVLAREPGGDEEFTITNGGGTEVLYHSLGHVPKGWRVVDQSTALDQPLQRTDWDEDSITLQNNGTVDFTGSVEVF